MPNYLLIFVPYVRSAFPADSIADAATAAEDADGRRRVYDEHSRHSCDLAKFDRARKAAITQYWQYGYVKG